MQLMPFLFIHYMDHSQLLVLMDSFITGIKKVNRDWNHQVHLPLPLQAHALIEMDLYLPIPLVMIGLKDMNFTILIKN